MMFAAQQVLFVAVSTIYYGLFFLSPTQCHNKLAESASNIGNISTNAEFYNYPNVSLKQFRDFNVLQKSNPNLHSVMDIGLGHSIATMNYHRQMMNTYRASTYLAEQIAAMLEAQNSSKWGSIEKRIGIVNKNMSTSDADKRTNHNWSNDVGSLEYSLWLNRLATIQDIKNYLQNEVKTVPNPSIMNSNEMRSLNSNYDFVYDKEDESFNDLDEGYITGYAFTKQAPHNAFKSEQNPLLPYNPDVRRTFRKNLNKIGYDPMFVSNHGQMLQHAPLSQHEGITNQLKEISLKDVVEVALTTLGFLSFGMLILQILMCITMNRDDANGIMLPMNSVDTEGAGITEEIRRKRRSLPIEKQERITMINNIARKMLIPIMMYAPIEKNRKPCDFNKIHKNQFFIQTLMQHLSALIWK